MPLHYEYWIQKCWVMDFRKRNKKRFELSKRINFSKMREQQNDVLQ